MASWSTFIQLSVSLCFLYCGTSAAQGTCTVNSIYGVPLQGTCFDLSFSGTCTSLNMTVALSPSCSNGLICCAVANNYYTAATTANPYYTTPYNPYYTTPYNPYYTTPYPYYTNPTTLFPGQVVYGQNFCGVSLSNVGGGVIGGGGDGSLPGGFTISPRSDDSEPSPARSSRILGGASLPDLGRYCWIAAISAGNNYVASGALLNAQWVITSANSVRQYRNPNPYASPPTQPLSVRLGQTNINTGVVAGNVYQVVNIVLNPQFRILAAGYPVNDVALLQLATPVDLASNPTLCGACLPAANQPFTGERCHAAGYGVTQETSSVTDGQLRDVLLPIIPRQVCDVVYRAIFRNQAYTTDPTSMCAGGELGKDTCLKDGGAPLTCIGAGARGYYILAAVSSWGIGCGRYGTPSMYSDLSNQGILAWIQSVAGATFPPPNIFAG